MSDIAYKVAKTHGIPYVYRSFSAKWPIFSGSFVENDLQLRGSYESSPPCSFENTKQGPTLVLIWWFVKLTRQVDLWVMAHIWMSHGTHMNESWHTYEWVMAHIWMSHGTHTYESRCIVTHSYVTWLIHMCAMTHLYVCHDSFICVCPMSQSHVCHDSFRPWASRGHAWHFHSKDI